MSYVFVEKLNVYFPTVKTEIIQSLLVFPESVLEVRGMYFLKCSSILRQESS